jgi:MFS family permease
MAEAQSIEAAKTNWPGIVGVTATVSVFAMAQGLSYPLLSFILQRQGVPPSLIGLSAAMTPLGFIVSSPVIPSLARRFGAGRVALSCAALSAMVLALVGWTQDLNAWFVLRFLIGVVTNPLYVLSEVWMIALAPPARRGRIMGLYTSIISAGFAAGPLCLLTVGTHGWPPFLVGIGAFIVCGACLASVLGRLPRVDEEGEKASVLGFLPLAWLLLAAVVVAAGYEQALLSLMPVFGAERGLPEADVSALLTAFIAGNIALQIPLGLLAERLTARRMLFVCGLASAVGSALIPVLLDGPLIWPVVFVLGAVSFGIYTMALIELGERFSGTMLVAGNAAFSLMWGVGGIVVSPAVGAAMDLSGANGLPVSLTLICLALSAAALRWRSR